MKINLILKDFQIFDKAEFEFVPGVNIITGPNSSGKTAVFRAIEALILNKASSRWVKKGKTEAAVVLKVEGKTSVAWIRRGSGVIYRVGKKEYRKMGRKGLLDIDTELKIKKDLDGSILNMQNEWEGLFPFSKSPSETFKLFESIFQVFDSSVIYEKIRNDIIVFKRQKEEALVKREFVEKNLKELEAYWSEFGEEIGYLDIEGFKGELSFYEDLKKDIEEYKLWESRVNLIGGLSPLKIDFAYIFSYKDIVEDFKSIQKLEVLLEMVGLEEYTCDFGIVSEVNNLVEGKEEIENLDKKVEMLDGMILKEGYEKEKLKKELGRIKVCPLCGREGEWVQGYKIF